MRAYGSLGLSFMLRETMFLRRMTASYVKQRKTGYIKYQTGHIRRNNNDENVIQKQKAKMNRECRFFVLQLKKEHVVS